MAKGRLLPYIRKKYGGQNRADVLSFVGRPSGLVGNLHTCRFAEAVSSILVKQDFYFGVRGVKRSYASSK